MMKLVDNHNYSVIILAGGNSTRMGFPKPWLIKGNTTFLSAIIDSYKRFGIKNIVVVLNKKFASPEWEIELNDVKKNATLILNSTPQKGRLYSLSLGVKAIKSDFALIHNVDNPFVDDTVLETLISHKIDGITIPSFKGKGGHPVIISPSIQKEIVGNYQRYETLKEVFANFPKKRIEVKNDAILKNINTPQELGAFVHELA